MEEVKDIVFFTLILGWKKEKRPSGPTELDLEAGNLVETIVCHNFWNDSIFVAKIKWVTKVYSILLQYQNIKHKSIEYNQKQSNSNKNIWIFAKKAPIYCWQIMTCLDVSL